MTEITYAKAFIDGLHSAMSEDPRVRLIGSYVLGLGPLRGLVDRIRDDFGDRVIDPPISEAAVASLGAGAAMAGARPFVDVATGSFVFQAWAQIVNEAGPAHYMSGGQISVPVVYHMLHGIRGGGAAQHSHSPQAMLWNCPGLEIVVPSSPRDVKGLVRTAVASDNPTVFVDHSKLLGLTGEVPDETYEVPFGEAEVKRAGSDVTVVATSFMVHESLAAAGTLADEGISVEVVDPRTLVPLDERTILDSVAKTGRLVVVDECNLRCGVASEIAATVAEAAFADLKAPVKRVARPDVPVPFSPGLEARITPTAATVADAVRQVLD